MTIDFTQTYWLLAWADAHDVTSAADAKRLLRERRATETLRQFASEAEHVQQVPPKGRRSILAGRGLDLSTYLSCPVLECRKRQVDDLLSRVWFYFDSVVVDDRAIHDVSHHWQEEWRHELLAETLELSLYLRSLGAEHLVRHRWRPLLSQESWRAKSGALGVERAPTVIGKHVASVVGDAKYEERVTDDLVECVFLPEDRSRALTARFHKRELEGLGESERRARAATWVIDYHSMHLVADLSASRQLKTPLASTDWLHQEALLDTAVRPEQVLFRLQLPTLDGLDVRRLLELREAEAESFDRFRFALHAASQELADKHPSEEPAKLAQQVREERIEPELENIRSKLRVAEKSLGKKTAVNVTLGALATTCGLLAGLAPGIAVGAGTAALVAGTAAAASKKVDDDGAAELSGMFFLWRAAGHGGAHESRRSS